MLGLELGADDYVAKPFSLRELVARCARRCAAPRPRARGGRYSGEFELDAAGQRIHYGGDALPLTRLEYGLLRALSGAPGRILSARR